MERGKTTGWNFVCAASVVNKTPVMARVDFHQQPVSVARLDLGSWPHGGHLLRIG